ncbi:MAG TPA: NDP-sugar synthase [Blastocatellia bacterium]|nr:NDP-sugar synthase [Blastocatellia bacterium]
MKAMILAAGFGTRLWPLTEDRTKPAIPFLKRPLIAYTVEYLASHGIRDIIVNLHHQPDSITRALGDGSHLGVKVEYSYEEEILGTSGAIDRVRDKLEAEDFIVINGKIVTDIDLSEAISAHRERQAIATLILRQNVAREHFSIVEVDDRSCVSRFAGFPEQIATEAITTESGAASSSPASAKSEDAPLMFTGIQVLSPRIFEYVPRGCFSHSTIHVYPRAMAEGETVLAHRSEGQWYEMSTLDRYLEASVLFMRKNGMTIIDGANCEIAADAQVHNSVLWDGVKVGSNARVRESVLGENVAVPAGAVIERAVVVRRDIVRDIERGLVVGENLVVPL